VAAAFTRRWHIVKVEEKAKLPGDMMPSDLGDILGDESKKSQVRPTRASW
jgi:hypothetical protein